MLPSQIDMESARMEDGMRGDIGLSTKAGRLVWLMIVCAAAMAMAFVPQSTTAAAKRVHLPYVTIYHPQFIPASQATFLSPDDLLIGVTGGKTAKAYPAAILAQHGVVQDRIGNEPIAVTWCGHCNTALVLRATVGGKALVFDMAGLIGGNEVFRDRQTGSRWQQSTHEAISGPLKGTRLAIYPFLLTTWPNGASSIRIPWS